jgi:serine/threonine-protein kinase
MQATPLSFKQAFHCAQQAVDRDPEFALAHAWMAGAYAYGAAWLLARPRTFLPLARAAAERALELDDSIALAYGMLAFVKHVLDWDWEGAATLYARALDLDPHDSLISQAYCNYLLFTCRPEEAIAVARRAVELDPMSAGASHALGIQLVMTRRWQEAEAALAKTLSLKPNRGEVLVALAGVELLRLGFDNQAALARLMRGVDVSNRDGPSLAFAARHLAKAGRRDDANAMLSELEHRLRQQEEYVSPYCMARIHAAREDPDTAFAWLDKALDERDSVLQFVHGDYALDELRSDPRYHAIIERMGLTKYVS